MILIQPFLFPNAGYSGALEPRMHSFCPPLVLNMGSRTEQNKTPLAEDFKTQYTQAHMGRKGKNYNKKQGHELP